MPVPTSSRPRCRNRDRTMIFSRKISRTVPSVLMRYSELSPMTGMLGGEAGVPLDSSVAIVVAGDPPIWAGLASSFDFISVGVKGGLPIGVMLPGLGRNGVLPVGRLTIAEAV